MKAPTKISIELDWSRLLGFDQTIHAGGPRVTAAKVGDKDFIGRKPVTALSAEVGSKTCLRKL
ncbi:MAG: hypothetical protein WEC00_02020 [Dongiaceae bacterium]